MANEVKLIEFPKIHDQRGNLTFVEQKNHTSFVVERVFWIYDVPGGEERGGHAYKEQKEVIIALSGSFDVVVKDAMSNSQKYSLNRSYHGLYLPPNTWRHIENFSTNALGLHLSSHPFDENDYIRNFDDFKE